MDYLISSIQEGIFRPAISIESIIIFISISIDGISQSVAMSTVGNNNQDKKLAVNVSEMFRTLSKAIINFLET